MTPLTAKQQAFVNEYVIDRNGSAAAVRSKFSKKNAQSIASRLLDKPAVQEAIKAKCVRLEEKTDISAEYVLAESKAMVDWYKRELESNGSHVGTAVNAANHALDRISKILGFTTSARLELTGKGGGPIQTRHVDFSGYATSVLEKFIDSAEG